MTKTVITILIIIALAVGLYFVFQKPDNTPTVNDNGTTNTSLNPIPEPTDKKMAFTELMKQKGTYECTVNMNLENTSTVGKMYLNSEKIRAEYTMLVQGNSLQSNYLYDGGDYAYVWSSSSPDGVKFRVDKNNVAGNNPQQPDYSQVGDYDCKAWTADSAKFTPPTNVTFTAVN